MAIPKYNETFFPILNHIKDGTIYNFKDVTDFLLNNIFELSDEEKGLRMSNWYTMFFNNCWRWKTFLKKAWLLDYPKSWNIQITDEWKRLLSTWIKEIDKNILKKYPSFLEFMSPKKNPNFNKELNKNDLDNDDIILNPEELMEKWYNLYYQSTKEDLLNRLKTSDPYYFEVMCNKLLEKMWYWEYKLTSKSRDWWIDWIVNQDELWMDKIYIQCKRYDSKQITELDIRNFIWAMSSETSKWIFITTANFGKDAIEKAERASHKIILINWDKLVDLMIKYDIGVQVQQIYTIKTIDEDYFNKS